MKYEQGKLRATESMRSSNNVIFLLSTVFTNEYHLSLHKIGGPTHQTPFFSINIVTPESRYFIA